jgi:hypothetical protein
MQHCVGIAEHCAAENLKLDTAAPHVRSTWSLRPSSVVSAVCRCRAPTLRGIYARSMELRQCTCAGGFHAQGRLASTRAHSASVGSCSTTTSCGCTALPLWPRARASPRLRRLQPLRLRASRHQRHAHAPTAPTSVSGTLGVLTGASVPSAWKVEALSRSGVGVWLAIHRRHMAARRAPISWPPCTAWTPT